MDKLNIIAKIKACLAKGDATRNPSEAEVETALRIARELMAAHNLTMADIAANEGSDDVLGEITETALNPHSEQPKWEQVLAHVCDFLFGVKHYVNVTHQGTRHNKYHAVVFYGYATDLALAVEVYKLLKLELRELANHWAKSDPACLLLPGKQSYTRKMHYLYGVTYTLYQRAKAESSANESAKVKDLVVRKDVNLDKWADEKYDFRQMKAYRPSMNGDAVGKGISDGRGVSLKFNSSVRGGAVSRPLGLTHRNKGESQ